MTETIKMDRVMKVFSGTCCQCDVGRPTGEKDMYGKELFTGDLVILLHGNYVGTDLETWFPSGGLHFITANQYQSYSNGVIKIRDKDAKPFTMGIADVGVQGGEWKVILAKSHKDVIEGERYPECFGLEFKKTQPIYEVVDA